MDRGCITAAQSVQSGQSVAVNRFDVRRLDFPVDAGGAEPEHWDLVVPVIDGVPLADRMSDRAPGTFAALVFRPSPHWLGEPHLQPFDDSEGRAEVLTGTCGESGCCGVFARITFGDDRVTWNDFEARGAPAIPEGLTFVFDRAEYEAAIDGLADH